MAPRPRTAPRPPGRNLGRTGRHLCTRRGEWAAAASAPGVFQDQTRPRLWLGRGRCGQVSGVTGQLEPQRHLAVNDSTCPLRNNGVSAARALRSEGVGVPWGRSFSQQPLRSPPLAGGRSSPEDVAAEPRAPKKGPRTLKRELCSPSQFPS